MGTYIELAKRTSTWEGLEVLVEYEHDPGCKGGPEEEPYAAFSEATHIELVRGNLTDLLQHFGVSDKLADMAYKQDRDEYLDSKLPTT